MIAASIDREIALHERANARWLDAMLRSLAVWSFLLGLLFIRRLEGITSEAITQHTGQSLLIFIGPLFAGVIGSAALFVLFKSTLDMKIELRIPLYFVAIVLTAWALASVDLGIYGAPSDGGVGISPFASTYVTGLIFVLGFAITMLLFYDSFLHRKSCSVTTKIAAAELGAQKSEIEAHNFLLNSHFLFNALNTISSLVLMKRNQEAEELTHYISKFLGLSLARSKTDRWTLEEELELVDSYLQIETVRYGSRLETSIDCEPLSGTTLLPSLTILPVVEFLVQEGASSNKGTTCAAISSTMESDRTIVTISIGGSTSGEIGGLGQRVEELIRSRRLAAYGIVASVRYLGESDLTTKLEIPVVPHGASYAACTPQED